MPENNQPASEARKSLPQNIEAEQTVLAACLLSTGVFEEVSLKLKPESFFRPAHKMIFEAMREMNARSIPIDVISVSDNLKAAGQLEAVGGQQYLLELADNTFAFTSWQHHAEIVSRDAIRRELLMSAAFKGIQELLVEANEEIAEMGNREGMLQGVPTGFIDVDKLFCGLRPGNLIILAARPAVGKTSFAMNLAANAAKSGAPVAFFSLEMSSNEITQRLLAAEAGLALSRMRNGQLTEGDWSQLIQASSDLSNCELYVDDSAGLSIVELRTKARRMMRNKKNGLIIVDYLQLMQPVIPHPNNRAVEVAEISRGLKVLAKELEVPIISLSQLSRGVESRTDKRPMLSDLRESGSIEQDADIVMFIDRSTTEAEAESDSRPDWGMAELIVAKNRSGPTRDIPLTFIPEFTKFTNHFDDSRY